MKDMELYYHVCWSRGNLVILSAYWLNGVSNHAARAYCGNVFKTYQEADANKYDVYERLTGEKWKERQQSL